MPKYNLTSAKTGASYKLEFAQEPTAQDVDEALNHLDSQSINSRGGIGETLSSDIAQSISRNRQSAQEQNFPKEGVFPKRPGESYKSLSEAFSSGALRGVGRIPGEFIEAGFQTSPVTILSNLIGNSLGKPNIGSVIAEKATAPIQDLTGKALNLAGLPVSNPENPEFKNPQAAALGETIGQLVALNPRLATSPISSAKDIGSFLLKATAPKVAARVAPATSEQAAMAALDLPKTEVNQHIPVVNQRIREVSENIPTTAEEAVSVIKNAKKKLYNDRLAVNDIATEQGLAPSGDEAVNEAQIMLDNLTTVSKDKKKSIIDNLKDIYGGRKSPKEGQKIQQDLNDKFSAAYENGTIDRANPEFQAEKTIRDSFANQMDEIHKAVTGINDSPYSDIGSLIEVEGALSGKLNKVEGRIASQKTGIDTGPEKLPIYKHGVVHKIANKIAGPLQKTQLEKLDATVPKIFGEGIIKEPATPLSDIEIQALRSKYLKGPEEPVIPSNTIPFENNPKISESDIEDLIKTYPLKLRKDPALARLAALSELQSK